MSGPKGTPEGEVLLGTMVKLRRHLDSHGCKECQRGYANLILAISKWVGGELPAELPPEPKEDWNVFG